MAAPLTNAKVGTGSSPSRRNTSCPCLPVARASSFEPALAMALRSAPTAKMNGFPVTPAATIAPSSASLATSSSAASMLIRPRGPKVVGLVWSKPLSRVTSANLPAPPGRSSTCTGACVTTSSGNAAVACSIRL